MSLTFANKVTIGRILIVPFFIATVLYYSPERDYLRFMALALFLTAMVSDVIDGYIARTRKQKTQAGALLDPLADKFLLMSAFLCLFKIGEFFPVQFPLWMIVAVISRDVILLLGAVILYMVKGTLTSTPSFWGRATVFSQVFCVIGLLLQWPFLPYLFDVTVALTVVSGLGYLREGIRALNVPAA